MESSLSRSIWNETRREQTWTPFVTLTSMPFNFWLLDLLKYVADDPIEARGSGHPDATRHDAQLRIPVPLAVKQDV